MKHRLMYSAGIVCLIVGLSVMGVLVKAVAGSGGHLGRSVPPVTAAQGAAVTAVQINGNFSGQVSLGAVATGVYSDNLTVAGNQPNLTFNPLDQAATITAYIVQVAKGDLPHGSVGYQTIFAAGLTLFVLTLGFNLIGYWLRRRYREAY